MMTPYDPAREMRLRRHAAHLCRLGPVATLSILREVEAGADLADRLAQYAEIDAGFVHALGGDRWPEPQLRLVPAHSGKENRNVC